MLIEILNIPPIVVNAFFSLSQTVDVLVRRPLKAELRMIGFVIFHGAEIFYKIPLSVHSLYSVDHRFFAACIVNHIRRFRQFFSPFPEKDMSVCGVHPAKASVPLVRFQKDLSCPDSHSPAVFLYSKISLCGAADPYRGFLSPFLFFCKRTSDNIVSDCLQSALSVL